jgi:hypothetical protein
MHPKYGMRFKVVHAAIAYALISFIYFARHSSLHPPHPDVTECKSLNPIINQEVPNWWSHALKMLWRTFPNYEHLHWDGKNPSETKKQYIDSVRDYFYTTEKPHEKFDTTTSTRNQVARGPAFVGKSWLFQLV